MERVRPKGGIGLTLERVPSGGGRTLTGPMARAQTIFTCSTCGTAAAKWHGRCPSCGDWNTLVEEAAPARAAGGGGREVPAAVAARVTPLSEVRAEEAARLHT